MGTCVVKTGFGYIADSAGHIICKAELPIGEHPLEDGYEYHEVEDKAAIEKVEIFLDPIDFVKQTNEAMIQEKMRQTAIAAAPRPRRTGGSSHQTR